MKNYYKIFPIGIISNEENQWFIEVKKQFQLGLFRLDTVSHAFILWWIHGRDDLDARNVLKVFPRVKNALKFPEEMGVFATRSPNRPNPIGLTLVKIKSVIGNRILIDYIDAHVGTPVIDIKPYLPNGDRIERNIYLPPWFQHLLISRPSELNE